MHVELYMIFVQYDHSVAPQQGLLPILSINIGDKIAPENDQEWVIPNHYRNQNESIMRQIGIRFVDKGRHVKAISIKSPDEMFSNSYVYHSEENIWFEPTRFSTKKRKHYYLYETDSILTGITNAGTAKLRCDEDGQARDFAIIHFVPSSLSIEDYEDMIADLYRIHEDFVRDDRNVAKVAIKSNKVVMELQEQLRKLTSAIKQINVSPHATLKLYTTKKKPQNSGRFDLRMEIEQYINPGKPNYRSRELKPVVATFENKLIKQMLEDLIHYATVKGSDQTMTKVLLRNVLNEREAHFRKSDLEIQRLLGSVEMVEDLNTYNRVHSKLMRDIQPYLEEERQIREDVKAKANFISSPNGQIPSTYVELTLAMNGLFTESNSYYHHQSDEGMTAQLKYDRRETQLKVQSYIVPTQFDQPKIPNSHFGTLQLISGHAQSHIRFYKAFCEEAQLKSVDEAKMIHICGFVRPQPNGVDAVATPIPNSIYRNYSFNFVHISSIRVDGNEITVPAGKNDLLAFLDKELPVKMHGAEQSEPAFMRLKQLEQLQIFTKQKENIHSDAEKYDELREAAQALLELPLFSSLVLKERLPVKPTQMFMHNPSYRVAWQALQQIKHELSASLFVQQHQRQISTGKVEQIFEVWTLYKIIHILTKEMGWKIDGYKDITSCLDQYMMEGSTQGLQNFSAILRWEHCQVELYYEPKIHLTPRGYLTPDFVLKFKMHDRTMGLVILDAKYRNYESQGTGKWKEDVVDIAIKKYGHMHPIEPKWQVPILASCILHSDVVISENAEDKYNPYHVMYNEALFKADLCNEEAHKYGSIYMVPSMTHVFKNWFRLIMEYHLGEYKVCWYCGEAKEVHERQLLTQAGYPKYYYTCKSCNEFWVKVHCRSNHHKLIKHMNNYHLQVESRRKWYVVCPSCGDGRPRVIGNPIVTISF
ncbi:hypothetical protein CN391_25835 [Bacillus anthracis]|nr:hypothetical protein CN391_25835 [Bacillus anthracis]